MNKWYVIYGNNEKEFDDIRDALIWIGGGDPIQFIDIDQDEQVIEVTFFNIDKD